MNIYRPFSSKFLIPYQKINFYQSFDFFVEIKGKKFIFILVNINSFKNYYTHHKFQLILLEFSRHKNHKKISYF